MADRDRGSMFEDGGEETSREVDAAAERLVEDTRKRDGWTWLREVATTHLPVGGDERSGDARR